MITPSFALTATERVLPKLALDFTTASLDSRVTFTRTTDLSNPATYVNSSGIFTAATNNEPRFDYDPATLVCKGLLIEESRTNTSLYSSDFSTDRIATRVTVSSDATTAPDGSANGDKLIASIDNNTHTLIRSINFATSPHTVSYFFKAGEYSRVRLYYGSFAATRADFDLSAGTVVAAGTAAPTATITNAGNGWYRCVITFTGTGSAVGIGIAMINNAGATSFAGNASDGIFVFGEQYEAGAFATSYIPTTTTALTRNADVATITGTDFSDWWQVGFGGVSVSAIPSTVSGTRPLIQFDDNTADNLIVLQGNTTDPELYIVDSTTPQAQIDAGTIAAGTPYTLTGWWQTDFCAARLNNSARVEDLTATIPTVTQARLGSDGTNYLNGHLATINYYARFSGQIYSRRKNKAVFNVI
jgi:hypothetical protein